MSDVQKSPITRRAITKGVAWSVPAFAIATAAPALAQSPLITIVEGDVCKYPGNSGPTGTFQSYLFPVTITNLSNEPVCITATGAQVILTDGSTKPGTPKFWNKAPGSPGAAPGGTQVCLEIGQSATYWLVLTNTGNSSNSAGTAYVDVQVTGQTTGRSYTDQASVSFGSTPPECGDYVSTAASTATADESKTAETSSDDDARTETEATQGTAAESGEADPELSGGTSAEGTDGDGAAGTAATEDPAEESTTEDPEQP